VRLLYFPRLSPGSRKLNRTVAHTTLQSDGYSKLWEAVPLLCTSLTWVAEEAVCCASDAGLEVKLVWWSMQYGYRKLRHCAGEVETLPEESVTPALNGIVQLPHFH
jgi:hypothetical protein